MLERESNPHFSPDAIDISDIVSFIEHPEKRVLYTVDISAKSALALGKHLRSSYNSQQDGISAQVEIGGGEAANGEGSYLNNLAQSFVGAHLRKDEKNSAWIRLTQNDVEYVTQDLRTSITGMRLIMKGSNERPKVGGFFERVIPSTLNAIDGVRELQVAFSSVAQREVYQDLLIELEDQRRDLRDYLDRLKQE
ncbi:MAG: hypothetical protein KBC15_01545 [Candidatus Levybacteria bacterium]|nr:hypothetical protein [Candidatus Levybacteria bacterium]